MGFLDTFLWIVAVASGLSVAYLLGLLLWFLTLVLRGLLAKR